MNEISEFNNYDEFKKKLDVEFSGVAAGFVRIGYLLKVARDTNIVEQAGYNSVFEFATAEYQLEKTAVSRFMAINDRYAKDGYSMEIEEGYQEYGYSKLSEMLTLPDMITEELTPDYTREKIREIKKEITEENQITDLEVLMEETPDREETLLRRILYYLFEQEENWGRYREVYKVASERKNGAEITDCKVNLMNTLAPSGYGMLSVRVSGTGKCMLSIKEEEDTMTILNIRTNEKEIITYLEFLDKMYQVFNIRGYGPDGAAKAWENKYGYQMTGTKTEPVKTEPVPASSPEKKESPKTTDPKKAARETENKAEEKEPVALAQQEEQLKGQMSVNDLEETAPDTIEKPVKEDEPDVAAEQLDTEEPRNQAREYIQLIADHVTFGRVEDALDITNHLLRVLEVWQERENN